MDVGPEVDELLGPPCQAAGELIAQGISHIATLVSDEHPAPPAGPVSIDQILI